MKDAQCVLWFHETKSPISVQREFQWCYERVPPDIKRTIQMNDKFKETDSVSVLPVSNVDLVRPSYQLDVHQVNREYWLKFIIKYFTCMPLQSMSCKPLSFRCAVNFLIEILGDISMDKVCIYHVSYSYVSGKVNRCKQLESENPHTSQAERENNELNVLSDLVHNNALFTEKPSQLTFSQRTCKFIAPQLKEFQPLIIYQQCGAHFHWGFVVRQFPGGKNFLEVDCKGWTTLFCFYLTFSFWVLSRTEIFAAPMILKQSRLR